MSINDDGDVFCSTSVLLTVAMLRSYFLLLLPKYVRDTNSLSRERSKKGFKTIEQGIELVGNYG